jgi:hypothetical protein
MLLNPSDQAAVFLLMLRSALFYLFFVNSLLEGPNYGTGEHGGKSYC